MTARITNISTTSYSMDYLMVFRDEPPMRACRYPPNSLTVEVTMELSIDVAKALARAMRDAESDVPGPSSANGITREINEMGRYMADHLRVRP